MFNKIEFDSLFDVYLVFQKYFYNFCYDFQLYLVDLGLINNRGFLKVLVCVGGFSLNGGMMNDFRFFSYEIYIWKILVFIFYIKQCNFGLIVLNNEVFIIGGCFND